MTEPNDYPEDDPRNHTTRLRASWPRWSTTHARTSSRSMTPRAQALLETAAEVCGGLVTAMEHYKTGAEPAWRR